VTEDVGTTPRRKLSTRDRLAVWEEHRGVCCICAAKIQVGEAWIVEHRRALELGGADTRENMAPAHERCARAKTKDDHARTAKAKRVKAKHIGAKAPSRNPLPGSRNSKWKRKMDGSVVPR
jgi:5-methylcytosine-specific restriction endonuclease McrA